MKQLVFDFLQNIDVETFIKLSIPEEKLVVKKPTCPECNHVHEDPHRPPSDCDMVYGRRGWRQLGVYDG